MEISVEELNELLQKEYERGKGERPTIYTPYSQQIKDWLNYKNPYKIYTTGNTPEACKNCSNHPSNGGSGVCYCILGTQPVMYTITTTSNEVK